MPNVFNANQTVKWQAVTLGGYLIASLTESDFESAKIFIRRLIWNLTEESGGCPYGSPELIGESLANSRALAEIYAPILISYIMPDGNFLEHEPLQAGVLWGIARLAEKHPDLCDDALLYLSDLLESDDAAVRGLTCWTLLKIPHNNDFCNEKIATLSDDTTEITVFTDNQLKPVTIASLARELTQ